MRVLIIDDDGDFIRLLRLLLERDGHELIDGPAGSQMGLFAQRVHADAILVDIDALWRRSDEMMPALRQATGGPLIVAAGPQRATEAARLMGLGADGWVAKPVEYAELLGRLMAAWRAAGASNGESLYDDGFLRIAPQEWQVWREGRPVALTGVESALLGHLVAHRGQVVSRAELVRVIWGEMNGNRYQYLANYVGRLRAKLEPDVAHPKYIRSRRGVGYLFQPSGMPGGDTD